MTEGKIPIVNCRDVSKFYYRRKRSGSVINPLNWFNFDKEKVIGVEDLNFTIHKGEKIGLIGPNGAGKSTFVKLLTGIISPTIGEITLFGIDPFDHRKLCATNYGVVFGNRDMLWKHVPVMESFKLAADIYRIDQNTLMERIDLFDSILDIKELLHVPPRKLSFGQRMKCQISYSLLHLPQIIILDEATIGLDVLVRHRVIQLLNRLVKEEQLTLIITSHLMEDVEKLADRLILLNKGKVRYDGLKSDFMQKYGTFREIKARFDSEMSETMFPEDLFKEIEIDENHVNLICNPQQVSLLVKSLTEFPSLEDITIGEPSLEAILRDLFEEGVDGN